MYMFSRSASLVTMQAQKEAPPDMQCKDKFLLQSVIAEHGATTKDITSEMVATCVRFISISLYLFYWIFLHDSDLYRAYC